MKIVLRVLAVVVFLCLTIQCVQADSSALLQGGRHEPSDTSPVFTPFSISTESGQMIPLDGAHVEAGTVDMAYVHIVSNSIAVPAMITVLKNDMPTDLKITIPANSTGWFSNQIDSVAVAAGDRLGWDIDPVATSGQFVYSALSSRFTPSNPNETYSYVSTTSSGVAKFDGADERGYFPVNGTRLSQPDADNVVLRMPFDATWRRLVIVPGAPNTRTTDTVVGVEINGVEGNQKVTFEPGQSGIKVATLSDEVSENDHIAIFVQNGAGGGRFKFERALSVLASPDGKFLMTSTSGNGVTVKDNMIRYFPVNGENSAWVDEADVEQVMPADVSLSNLHIYTLRDKLSGDLVVTLRINGADSALKLTVPNSPSQLGYFENETDIVSVSAGDKISYKVETGSGKNIRIGSLGVVATPN